MWNTLEMNILFPLVYSLHPSRTRAAQLQENMVDVSSTAVLSSFHMDSLCHIPALPED